MCTHMQTIPTLPTRSAIAKWAQNWDRTILTFKVVDSVNAAVVFSDRNLYFTCLNQDKNVVYENDIKLFQAIDVEKSTFKALSTGVVCTLVKLETFMIGKSGDKVEDYDKFELEKEEFERENREEEDRKNDECEQEESERKECAVDSEEVELEAEVTVDPEEKSETVDEKSEIDPKKLVEIDSHAEIKSDDVTPTENEATTNPKESIADQDLATAEKTECQKSADENYRRFRNARIKSSKKLFFFCYAVFEPICTGTQVGGRDLLNIKPELRG